MEQLTYGARLRMNANGRSATMKDVRERVDQLLDMMDLRACKDRVIPEYPALRGEEGGDMRRLSIAMEISGFPDLVLIDEPVLGFDPAIAMHIMSCINNYAEMGKIVCCSMSKPVIQMIPLIGKLVLLSYGHTIYAGAPANIEEHFCTNMGYRLKKGVDLFEFVLDIASGVERPVEQRTIELPSIMKDKFEQSAFFHQIDRSERFCSAFDAKHFRWYGYRQIENISTTFSRTMTVVERAILAKIKDFQTTKASFGIAIIVGLLVGYLQYGQGDYGRYATNLLGIPYANTTNCGALLFFSGSYMYLSHAVNCHIICEKLRLFKYEQSAGCCSLPAFVISVMLSDGPFVVAIAALFSNIIYWMTSLNFGLDNYSFYVGAIIMLTLEGLSAIYLFAVILRREFVIRESYLAVFTLLILMSGYAFQLSTMTYYIGDASVVNPIR